MKLSHCAWPCLAIAAKLDNSSLWRLKNYIDSFVHRILKIAVRRRSKKNAFLVQKQARKRRMRSSHTRLHFPFRKISLSPFVSIYIFNERKNTRAVEAIVNSYSIAHVVVVFLTLLLQIINKLRVDYAYNETNNTFHPMKS